MEIRLRFLEHPRKGRARHQAIEIGPQIFVRLGKRNDGVGVEERRRRRAVGQGEVVADRPGLQFHLSFHHAVGLAELRRCKVHAVRVGLALGTQPVTHDLLHRFLNVVVVEAVPHPRLPGAIRICGQKARRASIVRVQEFDDDGRFRHGAIARLVAQHRHLGHGPDRAEGRARSLVAQLDDNPLESNAVLVQGDERLVAEGRKRMEIKLQSHANGLALVPSNVPLR